MVAFCIHKRVIGHEKHLLVNDDGTFSLIKNIPVDTWKLTGHCNEYDDLSLDTLLRLSFKEFSVSLLPPERFVKPYRLLYPGARYIPWHSVMPHGAYVSYIETLIETSRDHLKRSCISYWESTWTTIGRLLRSLEKFETDQEVVGHLVSEQFGNSHAFKSMLSTSGSVGPVVYERLGSVTGRLNVKSGPQVQTVNREMRDFVFKSSYPGGMIYYVDMKTFEPKVASLESGVPFDPKIDMYSEIATRSGHTRNKSKESVMKYMYGTGSGDDALDSVISEFVNVDALRNRLTTDYVLNEFRNSFGRPLFTEDGATTNLLVSHFVQSTAADAALLAFEKLSRELLSPCKIRPLFVIHDAMFFDCPQDQREFIESIKTVSVEKYNAQFAVCVNKVTHENT